MAIFTLDDLTKPATRAEVQATIYRVLGLLGVNTTSWGSGAVVRAMIVGVSAVLAAFSSLQAAIARSGFLDLAEDDWLTLVARYVYGVERIAATFATGHVTLTNTLGGLYTLDVGDYIAANPATGKTYRNVEAFTLNPSSSVTVAMSAVEAGADSYAPTATITSQVTVLVGVAVTNADTFVGLDAESDPALRARCREKLGALSPFGPWDAYAFAARNARRSTGEPCGVTRTRVNKDGFGNVSVYVAGASGTTSGTLGDLTTDLGAVDDAINKSAEPLAINATAIGATAAPINVVYEAWAYTSTGMTAAQIKAAVRLKLVDFMAAQPIGGAKLDPGDPSGVVFVDALRAVISNALPQIYHVVVTSPAGDTTLALAQVPTLIHNVSTDATVHQVTPPAGVSL